jgi:uncharacterized protein
LANLDLTAGGVIIGMAHLPPLPGAPLYDAAKGMDGIRRWVQRDIAALICGGVDAIMFCNEGDRPYRLKAGPETIAAMAAVVGEVAPNLDVPFGVDILWDPLAALAVAAATGACFVREVFTGTYPSDMGLWNTDCAEALRFRRTLGIDHVKLLFNIQAEFAGRFDHRPVGAQARSVVFSSLADAVCVSGPMTGQPAHLDDIRAAKAAVPGTPVIANTGVRPDNVASILEIADAAIVGTSLKVDGLTWNPVDEQRVRLLMAAAAGSRRD